MLLSQFIVNFPRRFLKHLKFSATRTNALFMTSSAKKASRVEDLRLVLAPVAQAELEVSAASADSLAAVHRRFRSALVQADSAEAEVEEDSVPLTRTSYSSASAPLFLDFEY